VVVMEELFKVVVVGEVQVGKTSFVQRYSRNAFTENYRMTMGVDFAYKVLKWTDTQMIKLHLWDVAGQERYMSATKQFYRGASGCVVIYDLTSRQSFDKALLWKESIDAHASLPDGSPVPCLLLGNKSDLSEREVSAADMERACREHKFLACKEVSVKKNKNIGDAMRCLVEAMMGWVAKNSSQSLEQDNVQLNNEEKASWSCC
uniref:Ras-related protein Rab n=1 Tax=Petromyzon marinus TaxID=7757 RepID=S4RMZ0_PETMA